MKSTTSYHRARSENTGERTTKLVCGALLLAMFGLAVPAALAQVYGVRRSTAVVSGPNKTVVASKTTVVAGGGGLPHGYIATLPGGYRPIYVGGVRYYTVGGVYYRPQIYGGRTVYVVAHV